MSAQAIAIGLCECGCGGQTSLSTKTQRSRGRVKGRPQRFISGHNSRLTTPEYVVEDHGHDTPCWIWQRARDQDGYGLVTIAGRMQRAHRVYFERSSGAIPSGLPLDHLCRVHPCVRPDHLEPVTHTQNIRRGGATKLDPEKVVAIRRLRADETLTVQAIADRYGISVGLVWRVATRRAWADIDDPVSQAAGTPLALDKAK